MTTPGVVTIPQKSHPTPEQPTVIAAGLPKTIAPHPQIADRVVVVHRDGVETAQKVTINGVTIVSAAELLTTGQVTIHA
jgi:hypothetical protein